MAAAAAAIGSTPSPGPDHDSVGPQSGQAMVCAWNRRSVGSWYSAAQASHIGKPAIVVAGRS